MKQINDLEVEDHLADSLTVPPEVLEDWLSLNKELVRLPADLAYYGFKSSQAEREFMYAQADFERTEASLRIRLREDLAGGGSTRGPTESMVDAAVKTHERYHTAYIALIEAECKQKDLRRVVDDIKVKRDALMAIGQNVRAEMQADPVVRKQNEARRSAGQTNEF